MGRLQPYLFALVVFATFLVFLPSSNFHFVNWDDPQYVIHSNEIKSLSFENIKKIFGNTQTVNYHPLTTFSLAIDYHFFKLDPKGYHLTNVILHTFNTMLAFIFIFILSGRWAAALVTALFFGIHPLHVESVAWVTERKDCLHVFFYISTLIAYVAYLKNPKPKMLWLAVFLFLPALLAKAQAASLVLVLFLLDFYAGRKLSRKVFTEKWPFFALAVIFAGLVIQGGFSAEEFRYSGIFSWADKLFLAAFSFVMYWVKIFLPVGLSCLYPYPEKTQGVFPLYIYLSLPAAALMFWLVLKKFAKNRDALFGFLFFSVLILFMSFLLPVGHAFMADRFSYLASLGIFFMAASPGRPFFQRYKILVFLVLAVYTGMFVVSTRQRLYVWQNSETLWNDAIDKYPAFHKPYLYRGNYYRELGRFEKALKDYTISIRLKPDYTDGYNNRATLFQDLGLYDPALKDYTEALKINPGITELYANRANAYAQKGEYDLALADYEKVLHQRPRDAEIYYNRGLMYYSRGDRAKAVRDFQTAVSLKKDFPEAVAALKRARGLKDKTGSNN